MTPENGQRSPGPDRGRLPVDTVSLAGLLVCQSWPLASAALFPTLGSSHPLLLASVNGSLAAIAVAAAFSGSAARALLLPVFTPVPLWLVVNTSSWWAGRRFGPRAADWVTRRRPKMENARTRCERLIDRHRFAVVAGAFVIPVPSALIHAACGWRRMPLASFLIADALGIVARDAVFASLGYAFKDQAAAAVHAVARVSGGAGAVLILAAVVAIVLRRGQIARIAAVPERRDQTERQR